MDIDHAPTPPPAFGTVRNPNSQPPAYMSQTIQQSTTTTYGMPAYAKGTNNPAGPPRGMPDVEMEHWIQHQQFPSHVVDSGFHTALSSQVSLHFLFRIFFEVPRWCSVCCEPCFVLL